MWDIRVVKKMEVCVGRFIITCSFCCVSDNFEWVFAGVYGPNDDHKQKHMWDELVGIMSWWETPWCIEVTLILFAIQVSNQEITTTHLLWGVFRLHF